MTFKEFVISRVQLFFFLVTAILIASFILGSLFAPDKQLRYYHLLSPLILAACCVLPTCVTYFKKQPTFKQFIFRQIIELAMIEASVMLIISPPEKTEKLLFYIILGTVILIIYVLAMAMMWLQKYQQSKKLTEQLKMFQANA